MLIKLPAKPKKKYKNKPHLLCHPAIPKPLHEVNPRSVKGREWWDIKRQAAYQRNNYHCQACGVYKGDAKIFQWLEAHEIYHIDHARYRMYFKDVVALCHCCHAIIHAGRTASVYMQGKLSTQRFNIIVRHGQGMFKRYKIEKTVQFRFLELVHEHKSIRTANDMLQAEFCNTTPLDINSWDKWRLVIDRKLYKPKYATYADWMEKYHNELE